MALKESIIIVAALLLAGLSAGCFSDVKCVRDVEREQRADSLDVRTPDPTERMYTGRPDGRPIHENTGRIDLTRPLTLTRSIDIALEAHPEVRRVQAKIDGAKAHTRELETMGWAEFLADITYVPDAKMFMGEPRYYTGDRLRNNVTRFNVALRQPIYFEWQRRRGLLNANNEEIARLQVELEMKKNEVVASVCRAYLEVTRARRGCEHRRGVYHLDQKRVSLVQKLVERKLLLPSSEHKAVNFMEAARRDWHAAQGVLRSAERKLKNILGIDSRLHADIVPIEFVEIPLISFEEARDYLTTHSMEFDALDHAVEKARWDKEFNRWEDIDLDFYVRYGYDMEDWSKGVDDFLILSLALRYPLMHLKARNARVVRWLKRMEEFEIEREVQQQRLLNELETVYATVEEHRAEMQSWLSAMEEAKENLRMAHIFEQKGTTDESLKTDPENILFSIISAIAILNARFKCEEARLDYLGTIMDQYALLDRAAELAEFARPYDPDVRYAAQSRSLLVNRTQVILESPDERMRLLEICEDECISALYLRVEPSQFRLNALTEFIAQAHGDKMSVFAVMGNERWLDAETGETAEKEISEFLALQERCLAHASGEAEETDAGRDNSRKFFDGLHIDFRGKRLADWNDGQVWPKDRKERLSGILAGARSSLDAAPGSLSLGFSVDGAAPDRDLYADIAENCSQICVYLHKNKQNEVVTAAEPILLQFVSGGAQIKVVLETDAHLPADQTYHKQGSYMLWGEMAEIAEKLQPHPAFGGILIDDFHNLSSLKK